jgi:hypothetical protein
MVGVGQDERDAQLAKFPWRDSLDRSLGAHWGKDGGGDWVVWGMNHTHAGPAVGVFLEQLKIKRQDGFLQLFLFSHLVHLRLDRCQI